MKTNIEGYIKEGFENVEYAFRENFDKRGEVGASCCVYYQGEKVVDLWGGFRNKSKTELWEENTLAIVFSSTKGMSSLAFSILHSKGLIDFEEKVSAYWAEFSFNGKENITVRQLLAHQAGLYTNDKSFSLEILKDEEKLSKQLAKQKPYWTPGEARGYHAWTIAMYQNELCKRIDPLKRPLHLFFKEEIADPLGIDFTIGCNETITDNQIAEIIPFLPLELFRGGNTDFPRIAKGILNPFSHFYKSMLNPPHAINLKNFNKRKFTSIPNGSAHGYGNARSIAKAYNEFATGCKVLNIRKETLEQLEAPPIYPKGSKADLVLNVDIPFSLGFAKPSSYQHFGSSHRSYGSFGAGGSGGFADPDREIAFSYVMNKMGTHIANDPRETSLRRATYDCIYKLESNGKL